MSETPSGSVRLSKLFPLQETDSKITVENFFSDLLFRLASDSRFATFIAPDFCWLLKDEDENRGFRDRRNSRGEVVGANLQLRALELMLGEVASLIRVVPREYIVEDACSMNEIQRKVMKHYGFQKTGSRIFDLFNGKAIKLQNESAEAFWERLYSVMKDCLLKKGEELQHLGKAITDNEKVSPTLLSALVIVWLRGIEPSLPETVCERFAVELERTTLYSIRDIICRSIPVLLNSSTESLVARTSVAQLKNCCYCQALGLPDRNHFLSACKKLPQQEQRFLQRLTQQPRSRTRMATTDLEDLSELEPVLENQEEQERQDGTISQVRSVDVRSSPCMEVQYGSMPVSILLDSGAESDLISHGLAKKLKVPVFPTKQRASQADGVTPLHVIGETHVVFVYSHHHLTFHGLIVEGLSSGIIGGVPFQTNNDIYTRMKTGTIHIGDCCKFKYSGKVLPSSATYHVKILRMPSPTTLFPGDGMLLDIPEELAGESTVALEPRLPTTAEHQSDNPSCWWLKPTLAPVVDGRVEIRNESHSPVQLTRHAQVCNVRSTTETYPTTVETSLPIPHPPRTVQTTPLVSAVYINTSLPKAFQDSFLRVNTNHREVFCVTIGLYNGRAGNYQSVVNVGPSLPPQRKGRVPFYNHSDLGSLQEKFDELYAAGVLARPEDQNICIEYLNPSFLVRKANGQFRMVTSFGELGQYTKPQPSLLPNVDSVLRRIGQWKFIIKTDLSSAYYQIPLSLESQKFCGVASPFKGVFVYTRCAMGMPGSETALEEVMCRILGDLVREGHVIKIADDLYCGSDNLEHLSEIWNAVLTVLQENGLRLSAKKTEICPETTTVLGWIWSGGTLQASPHRISALQACSYPTIVRELRSYAGSYKFLGKVLPKCSEIVAPLDAAVAGRDSKEKLQWTTELEEAFDNAKRYLSEVTRITLPRKEDQLQIVTDASISTNGLAATLYVVRDNKPKIAGFFNARMQPHQARWLPCEAEALCIGSAVSYFGPYIRQSEHHVTVFTDSKPCVQAYERLCQGKFSSSARVQTFLSILCNFQAKIRHLKGSDNMVSDYASRNPIACTSEKCQICKFVNQLDDSVVRAMTSREAGSDNSVAPFLNRSAWNHLQKSCPDLRRVHSHLTLGTRPTRKARGVNDVKRYLNQVVISNDGLLVVRSSLPMNNAVERIVIPRRMAHGIMTAMHLRLNHPSKSQLGTVAKRHYFALNMDDVVDQVSGKCDVCLSLSNVPNRFREQSTTAPDKVGGHFSVDVMNRAKQCILVVRENVSAFMMTGLIPNETAESISNGIVLLVSTIRASSGSPITIRSDPGSGFRSLSLHNPLKQHGITFEIGHEKNVNKNPVAERAIRELHSQLARIKPNGGSVSDIELALATANVNATLRNDGLSSFELWQSKNQFTSEQLPVNHRDVIRNKADQRTRAHKPSAKFKARGKTAFVGDSVNVGDLVYLVNDRDKTKARNRYIVTCVDDSRITVHKFVGGNLRSRSYIVCPADIMKIPSDVLVDHNLPSEPDSSEFEISDREDVINDNNVNNGTDHPSSQEEHSNSDENVSLPNEGNQTPIAAENRDFDNQEHGLPPRRRVLPKSLEGFILDFPSSDSDSN